MMCVVVVGNINLTDYVLFTAGAYASGVIVLMNQSVKVSVKMTILVAVKNKGYDFKTIIYLTVHKVWIVITEPTLIDVTGTALISFCKANTRLKEECASYLKGNKLHVISVYIICMMYYLVSYKCKFFERVKVCP